MVNLFLYIIIAACVGAFSVQVVVSELSYDIRNALWLTEKYQSKLNSVSQYIFWSKLLGYKLSFFLAPLLFIIVFMSNVWLFLNRMLSCAYCQSVWYMLIVNLFVLNMSLGMSLLLAPGALLFVALNDRLISG